MARATVFVGSAEALVAQTTALSFHLLVGAIENFVLAQFAFQIAVEQRIAHRGTEPDLVGEFAIGNEPGIVALKHEFEPVADGVVEFVDVLILQSLAIGRIGDQHALFGRFLPVGDRSLREFNHLAQSGAFHIGLCNGNGLDRHVGTVDFVLKIPLLGIVVVDVVKQLFIVVAPVLEGIFLAIHARIDVGGNHSRLNQKRARATHRVHEIRLTIPAAQFDNAGGKHLIDRRFRLSHAPSSLIERRARRVERNGDLIGRNVYVEHHIGARNANRRPLSVFLFEIVNNGIFHAIRHESRVAKHLAKHRGVDGKGFVEGQHRVPLKLAHLLVEVVGIGGTEFVDGFENAQRRAATKIGLIQGFEIAHKRHHARALGHLLRPEGLQLVAQHPFQPLEGFGNHFKIFTHRNIG